MKNYYNILDISPTAGLDAIKKAYRQKAVMYHPDKHLGDNILTAQFVEINEAYQVLSDQEKRAEYDRKYKVIFPSGSIINRNINEKDPAGFKYEPYTPFYSTEDRIINKTPKFRPEIDHWGQKIDENSVFFKLPSNIGKIISGYTSLSSDKSLSRSANIRRIIDPIGISLAISAIIIYGFNILSPTWIMFWGLTPVLTGLVFAINAISHEETNTFIGLNGFAGFKSIVSGKLITGSFEVNFNGVTDLLRATQVRKRNYQYIDTAYSLVWLKDNRVIKEVNGHHNNEDGKPEKENTEFWINDFAERYWTCYLLDNMEKELENKSYIQFNLYDIRHNRYVKIPYIQLGIGHIAFLTSRGQLKYTFNEIKNIYTKGTNLHIEHSKTDQTSGSVNSGIKIIPLLNLSNRQFFYRALEILLGYKFS
jgi:curved DNA-binding protein CbpA